MVSAFRRQDRHRLLHFVHRNKHTHLHLDWEPMERWLRDGANTVALLWEDDQIEGAIAYSPLHNGTSWLRLASLPDHNPLSALQALQDAICGQLFAGYPLSLGALISRPWISSYLEQIGFTQVDSVINLTWHTQPLPTFTPPELRIRGLHFGEASHVLRVDHAAFPPLWQMRAHDLQAVSNRANYYTVAHDGNRIVGYQLSLRYDTSMHLARLAVLPEAQGQAVGSYLVWDMLRHAQKIGVNIVTVNTQDSNIASQRLYTRLGFVYEPPDLPVYTLELG